VERFFDALLPSEADLLVQEGSEDDLRRALELEPTRADAAIALARMLIARGEGPEALELLERVAGSFQADGLAARVRLQQDDELEDTFAALDRGELEPALQQLLDALPSAGDQREDVRRVIVGELDTLAPDDPLARRTRSGLAAALY
jgi:putative thioredoxin